MTRLAEAGSAAAAAAKEPDGDTEPADTGDRQARAMDSWDDDDSDIAESGEPKGSVTDVPPGG